MSTKKKANSVDAKTYLTKKFGSLTLGRAIRALRMSEETSQTDFAEILGVSRQYLCDLEADRKAVSVAKAAEFAKLLNQPAMLFIELAIQDELSRYELPFQVTVSEGRKKRA